MSVAWQFYISTVLIYLGVDVIACWGLNLQFGVAGLVNFAFIIFQAAGAYTAAVLTLGPAEPASQGGFQQYVGGAHWPFPLPILAAGLVGGLLAALVSGFTVRRLRSDYEAMVMLVVSLIATSVATNQVGLVNGPNGLALVPKPLSTLVNLSPIGYQWLFVGITAAICVCVYWLVHIVTSSPLGRALRAVRDNEQAAAALGKNVTGLRMLAFILGGVIAGISGAVLVEFISAWSPGSWLYPETFVYFTAVIVGGSGNNLGVMVGALLVPVAFLEATRFLPQFGQKRLLELMRGLMANPALLLLDEPMAGVNPSLARRIEQHLADLVGEGLTTLMIEHELAVVERLCDPVVVMAQGRVISEGTMADIRSDQEVLDAYLIG